MSFRPPRKRTAAALGLLALLFSPIARADAGEDFLVLLGFLVPADFGAAVPPDGGSPRLVIGWSWQIAPELFSPGFPTELSHHRIVPAVDLLPRADGVSWRGRLGYRYDRNHLFAGAGVGVDGSGVNLSPELGVKFLPALDRPISGIDISLHLLARAEIDPQTGHLRGATLLLGWNLL